VGATPRKSFEQIQIRIQIDEIAKRRKHTEKRLPLGGVRRIEGRANKFARSGDSILCLFNQERVADRLITCTQWNGPLCSGGRAEESGGGKSQGEGLH